MVDSLHVVQVFKEISVLKMADTVRLRSRFQHTVNYLRKMGVPADNSVQVHNST